MRTSARALGPAGLAASDEREVDLAHPHVHPEGSSIPGRIAFHASFPSVGRHRLFLQLRHDGRVRTVADTLDVAA